MNEQLFSVGAQPQAFETKVRLDQQTPMMKPPGEHPESKESETKPLWVPGEEDREDSETRPKGDSEEGDLAGGKRPRAV